MRMKHFEAQTARFHAVTCFQAVNRNLPALAQRFQFMIRLIFNHGVGNAQALDLDLQRLTTALQHLHDA